MTRVLVTGGEHIGPLGAMRGLHRAGHEVWATAERDLNYAKRSRAVAGILPAPNPGADPETFARACAAESFDVVLPGTEAALVALSGREDFCGGAAVGTCPTELVARATSKDALAELCAAAGLETPRTTRVRVEDIGEAEFPAVVKPLRSELELPDGTLVHAAPRPVATREELLETLRSFPGGEGLLQPFLSDRIYGFCGVAWRGKLVCSEHQLGERIWPADAGMVSYVATVERDADLDAKVARFIADLGWSGIFQIQFLLSGGRLYAIDLNPRIYISVSLAIEAGMNLPAIWVDLLLGREPRVTDYRVGVKWRWDDGDARAVAWHLARGDRRRGLRGLVPRRHTTHGVFSWRDPGPSLTTLGKLVRRG